MQTTGNLIREEAHQHNKKIRFSLCDKCLPFAIHCKSLILNYFWRENFKTVDCLFNRAGTGTRKPENPPETVITRPDPSKKY